MTSTALTIRRDHFGSHRRMIIGRSLAAAVIEAIPIPFLEEQLAYVVLRSMLRTIARELNIDMDDEAAKQIIFGKDKDLGWLESASSSVVFRQLARRWQRLLVAYMATRRAQAAAEHFTMATLFHHYCSKLHVGLGIDGARGLEIRAAMEEALAETPGNLSMRLFRSGLAAALRATVKAPVELIDMVSGGMLTRFLARKRADDDETVAELDTAIEQQLRSQKSFLARATTAIEIQLSVEGNPYLDELINNFERIWRARHGGKGER